MTIEDFPFCCTMSIAVGFGNSYTAEDDGEIEPTTKEEVMDFLKESMVDLQRYGDACMVVTTNNQQTIVNQALKELGFNHSPWMSKKTHRDTKVRLWWYQYDKGLPI